MNKHMLAVTLSALTLSACSQLPPQETFTPGALEPEPAKPVQIVEMPQVLPLPGQLQPEPGKEKAEKPKELRLPTSRVDAANKAATLEPTEHGYINAIQVYPFTEGALYQLYAAPERVSDIALQTGEKLVSVSSGDTVRWVIGDTQSGTGEEQQVHVLVKPFAPDLKTNLVITTDRRSYHVQMDSTARTFMAAVSWIYPQDQLVALKKQNTAAEAAQPVAANLSLENIRFRYAISGDEPDWKPMRAFDDGQKVYIEFPHDIAVGEAPPLFVVGADGNSELVNYRVRGSYYIVDRLFNAAELRLGTDPQQIVRIERHDDRNFNTGARP